MGSIARDAVGDILLGYSKSGRCSDPGIYVAGRTPSLPAHTLQDETVVVNGAGAQTDTSNRWGYYSAMRVDPTDNCTFWYTNEYYTVTRPFDWSTQIASVKFPTCAGTSTLYKFGDVFDSVGLDGSCRGCVKEVMPSGTTVRDLPDGSGYTTTTGTAFDVAGNLYVTNWDFGTVSKLNNGNVVNAAFLNPANDGQTHPESVRAVGTKADLSDLRLWSEAAACTCVLVYDSAGSLLTTIHVSGGTDWIEFLTPNILVYTNEGTAIKAYDISTSTQLPDVITTLSGYRAFQLRAGHPSCLSTCILPDPYLLVADNDYAVLVDPTPWLASHGSVPGVVKTKYPLPGIPDNYALAIDPDARHFWAGSLTDGNVVQVDICTGKVGYSWSYGTDGGGGLTVWGGLGLCLVILVRARVKE